MKKEIFTQKELLEIDKNHLFHPYSSAINPPNCPIVKSAKGVKIHLENGKTLIDGMCSWWSAAFGYSNKTINKAMKNQLKDMSHIMFGGLTHTPAITLANRLLKILPSSLNRVFFCDSGSVSVEVAMKMALQYWHKIDKNKTNFLTIKKGYHGDTWNAMSVCDPETGMHSIFSKTLPKHIFAPEPTCSFDEKYDNKSFLEFKKIFEKNLKNIAAVILEPIVQGAGSMSFYHPQFLKNVSKLCKKNKVLLILDEIATGFGRTGKMFACLWADISPDIMCIGKTITGGAMSFAATICSKEVEQGICANNMPFMHGPTFMANPLACSAANAVLDIFEEEDILLKVKNIETYLKENLKQGAFFKGIKDFRVLGAIAVFETKKPVDTAKMQELFIQEGIWVRPFMNFVYIMPAFTISKKQLEFLCKKLLKILKICFG